MFSDVNSDIRSERYSCLNMLARVCGGQDTHVPCVTSACTLTRWFWCHGSLKHLQVFVGTFFFNLALGTIMPRFACLTQIRAYVYHKNSLWSSENKIIGRKSGYHGSYSIRLVTAAAPGTFCRAGAAGASARPGTRAEPGFWRKAVRTWR